MSEQKFCKDCKWLEQICFSNSRPIYDCKNPIHGESINAVTGVTQRYTMNAQFARFIPHACGESGKWWEPKPPTYWQKLKTYFQ